MKNFYRDGGLFVSIIALIVIIFAMSGFIFSYSANVFWILAPIIVLVSGFAIAKLIQVTRANHQYFALIEQQLDHTNKLSLYNFPISVVIIDTNRKIVWYNTSFGDSFPDEAIYGNSIDSITSESFKALTSEKGVEIRFKGRYYLVSASLPAEDQITDVFLIYFRDITDYKQLQIEKKLAHPVVMVIKIDNYDELFSGSLESETAKITVQIDSLLESFIAETTGLLRKTGRDKFWAVLEERHVQKLLESKVDLLDKVHDIQISDRLNVTLSIGIGRTAKNISESEDFAKQALDMAQGRGGDQAAVKTVSGFEFYGGVSKGIERHTKVKTRIIANSLIQVVEKSDCVYIMGHKYSDLDSIGSAIGLASAIRNLGKQAFVVVDTQTTLSTVLIDRLKSQEPDKNSSLFLLPSKACENVTDNSLLVIVDTHNTKLLESDELYSISKKIVIIDHHRKMVDHIDNSIIFHHDPTASSAAEMVTELLSYFGNAGKITASQAEALLAGISLDTKNFTIKTGVRTFEAAAFLKKLGADTINVKGLFANSIDNYKLKARLVSSSEIYKRCALAYADTLSSDIRLVVPQAADELLGISNVDASFVFYTVPNTNTVSISARSLGALNVQLIMERMGGGGHLTMAGAQINGISLSDAKKLIITEIDNYYDSLAK